MQQHWPCPNLEPEDTQQDCGVKPCPQELLFCHWHGRCVWQVARDCSGWSSRICSSSDHVDFGWCAVLISSVTNVTRDHCRGCCLPTPKLPAGNETCLHEGYLWLAYGGMVRRNLQSRSAVPLTASISRFHREQGAATAARTSLTCRHPACALVSCKARPVMIEGAMQRLSSYQTFGSVNAATLS